MDIAAFKVSHSVGVDKDTTAISSGVVMDIAAVKVSHAVGVDKDATAHVQRCLIRIHVGVGQRCRAQDAESLTRISCVVMDIATFKVSHAVGEDIHATAEKSSG